MTAESIRLSRAAQAAAEMAGERAHQSQEQARLARIEAVEMRIHRAVQMLAVVMAVLWLIGLAVIVCLEVAF